MAYFQFTKRRFLLMALLVYATRSVTDNGEILSKIADFRDLKVTVYGYITDTSSMGPLATHYLMIFVDGYFVTTTQIPVLDQEFRVDEHLNDYLVNNRLFKNHLWVLMFITTSETNRHPGNRALIFNQTLSLFPDKQKLYAAGSVYPFNVDGVLFTLACYGYIGYNCEYKLTETKTQTTDFDTGKQVYISPKSQMISELECERDESEQCLNGGKCVKSYASQEIYCNCKSGYTGRYCAYETCDEIEEYVELTKEELECAEQCSEEEKSQCCNNATCVKSKGEPHCICDRSKYSGKTCQHECKTKCVLSHCTHDRKGAFCFISNEYLSKYPELAETAPLRYSFIQDASWAVSICFLLILSVIIYVIIFHRATYRYIRQKINDRIKPVFKNSDMFCQI